MQAADSLGKIPIEIVLGPDLYLFGEETGLEEVIEERPPLPRTVRPYIQGLFATPPDDNPTLVNNVETLANVPHILREGPAWLRANGTDASPGTMVFTVCGDVLREGVFELPLGSPMRSLVEEAAGGAPEGRTIKAIFPGASNTVIAPEELDTPMDFDSLREVGSGLGAGGFAVFDDSACMVQAAYRYSRFLAVESCGQCPACKFGTGEATEALEALESGSGSDRDIELVLVRSRSSTDGQKCALPTGESLLMQSLVQVFDEEFRRHVGRPCPLPRELPFHKIVDRDASGRFVYDADYIPQAAGLDLRMKIDDLLREEDVGWTEIHRLIDPLSPTEAETPGYFPEGMVGERPAGAPRQLARRGRGCARTDPGGHLPTRRVGHRREERSVPGSAPPAHAARDPRAGRSREGTDAARAPVTTGGIRRRDLVDREGRTHALRQSSAPAAGMGRGAQIGSAPGRRSRVTMIPTRADLRRGALRRSQAHRAG